MCIRDRLGANPVQALTGNNMPISRLRGNWLAVDTGAGTIPALATFNPAYLLRRPEEKAKAWADLLALRRRPVSYTHLDVYKRQGQRGASITTR